LAKKYKAELKNVEQSSPKHPMHGGSNLQPTMKLLQGAVLFNTSISSMHTFVHRVPMIKWPRVRVITIIAIQLIILLDPGAKHMQFSSSKAFEALKVCYNDTY